jgi:hypothetical protein
MVEEIVVIVCWLFCLGIVSEGWDGAGLQYLYSLNTMSSTIARAYYCNLIRASHTTFTSPHIYSAVTTHKMQK